MSHISRPPRRGHRPGEPVLLDDRRTDEIERPRQTPTATPAGGPVLDALTLLALWRRARMNGDRVTAAALLAELERLAERPRPRAGGDRDDTDE